MTASSSPPISSSQPKDARLTRYRIKATTWGKDLLTRVVLPRKWSTDARRLPLEAAHKPLYRELHRHCFRSIRRYPNLVDPQDFTDKLQWLKLFDQSEAVVECSDKLRLKEYVDKRLGKGYVPEVLTVGKTFDKLDLGSLPEQFVLKTNHDSGTVILVKDRDDFELERARAAVEASLAGTYGWEKGEWAYSLIEPLVFAEEYVEEASDEGLADYKFHCVDGRVAWLQYIYNRRSSARESLAERDGTPIPAHFSTNLLPGAPFRAPPELPQMVAVAEELAAGFRYVRVDLYLAGRILVGELTFFPLSGCYRGPGQRLLGQRLTFDRSVVKPPVVGEMGRRLLDAAEERNLVSAGMDRQDA